ncbi:hypothetical protein RR46_06762 [Papilio xuthus]|uniref:Uncharacterized protein n=1 Tax=Papilio xuthus TaxID=66420 RepID=A0A194PST2_PAPXU|nr:hypothetical protein RR46_06762 [Papilio xuthus]
MDALRKELADIREDLRRRGSAGHSNPDMSMEAAPASRPPHSPNEALSVEEICRAVMVQVGGMMNARLASLEDRLLPERNLRPPLAADKKKGESSSYAAKLARQPPQLAAQPGPSGTQRRAPPMPQHRSSGRTLPNSPGSHPKRLLNLAPAALNAGPHRCHNIARRVLPRADP